MGKLRFFWLGEKFDEIITSASTLVERMTEEDPNARPSVNEVIQEIDAMLRDIRS